MKKMHIVKIGYQEFAVSSITAANSILAALSKAEEVDSEYDENHGRFYIPAKSPNFDLSLKLNQRFKPATPPPAKPKHAALPKPKRAAIQCICGVAWVSPRETCRHCGRTFTDSHNRTHA